MNWKEEVIKLIDGYFKGIGVKYIPKKSVDDCLIDFFNFEMKIIRPIPRAVYKSDVLKGRILPLQYSKALHEIELKIKRGEELTLHLSKKALDPTYTDDLLNDWVIHHIHLSTTKSKPGQRFFRQVKIFTFLCA